jgi:serine/threonine protein kinase
VRLLEHEYAVPQGLHLAGVIRAHEILRDACECCLVLDDPGGMPLPALLPWRPLDLEAFFKLAIQLAALLTELHRHGIIHKQLNPASILIHPITGEVWLTDFSLASRTRSETPVPFSPSLLPSTLAYLSPEQTGRMNRMCELLTGSPPFRSADALDLIHCHIAMLLDPAKEDYRTAYEFGLLTLRLNERLSSGMS